MSPPLQSSAINNHLAVCRIRQLGEAVSSLTKHFFFMFFLFQKNENAADYHPKGSEVLIETRKFRVESIPNQHTHLF